MYFDLEKLPDLTEFLSTKEGQGLQNIWNRVQTEILSAVKSQDELDAINHYQAECDRLFQIGSSYQLDPAHPEGYYGDQVAYSQVAANATIHRGVYCPSPVYDILIGRTRRGRILQRPTQRSNITHRYYFDNNGKLCYVKSIYKGRHTSTEFLIPEEERIYGITLGLDGKLTAVCVESYIADMLQSYCLTEYCWIGSEVSCFRFRLEEYGYDNEGLSVCDVYTFNPMLQLCEHERYHFECKDGYLSSYTVSKLVGNEKGENNSDGHVFDITIKRKA